MFCLDCRGENCLNLVHDDPKSSQQCSACGGSGIIKRHNDCIKRNENKNTPDCDCQHRENAVIRKIV